MKRNIIGMGWLSVIDVLLSIILMFVTANAANQLGKLFTRSSLYTRLIHSISTFSLEFDAFPPSHIKVLFLHANILKRF